MGYRQVSRASVLVLGGTLILSESGRVANQMLLQALVLCALQRCLECSLGKLCADGACCRPLRPPGGAGGVVAHRQRPTADSPAPLSVGYNYVQRADWRYAQCTGATIDA